MRLTTFLLLLAAFALGACGSSQAASQPPATDALDVPLLEEGLAAPQPSPTADSQPALAQNSASKTQSAPVVLDEAASELAAKPATPQPEPSPVPQVQATPLPTPRPLSEPTRLVIGEIGMDRTLMSVGLDKQNIPIVPKHDVGWYNLSALPGQGENVVLWGHVLRFKSAPKTPAPFARLKELKKGAAIALYDKNGNKHTYVVTEQVWVTPDQVQYILPQGEERLTMVSCIGDKVVTGKGVEMTHRLVTIAKPA